MIDPNQVQHINIKIFVENPSAIDLADAIPVFHNWIKNSVCDEMLVDVADYRHVPAGPGVLLIGHQANYSLDHREGRLGLLYNRKDALPGTFRDRLNQAFGAALRATELLEDEPPFRGKLKFNRALTEVFVNDRLLAPNTDETWQALKPAIQEYFPGCVLERRGEPRDLFRVSATTR